MKIWNKIKNIFAPVDDASEPEYSPVKDLQLSNAILDALIVDVERVTNIFGATVAKTGGPSGETVVDCINRLVAENREKESRIQLFVKENHEKQNGSWLDKYGCCKVCGGEIPYGHDLNCDIYKLEQSERAAKEMAEALKFAFDLHHPDEKRRGFAAKKIQMALYNADKLGLTK